MAKRRKKKNKSFIKMIVLLLLFTVIASIGYSFYSSVRYPLSYETNIKKYADEYEVDPFLVASVICVESSFDKNANSSKDARGLMQIMPDTGQWIASKMGIDNFDNEQLFDPDTNIKMGTWYLNNLSNQFDGNIELALAAYNGGSGNVSKWLKDTNYSSDGKKLDNIPFKETEEYVKKVLDRKAEYEEIYEYAFINPEYEENPILLIINHIKKIVKDFVKNLLSFL